MICPNCKFVPSGGQTLSMTGKRILCPECNIYEEVHEWYKDYTDSNDLRPKHYEKGHDTFAWAEHKFDLETNLNICRFNIHRYNDRDKGQDVEDFEKIIAYAQRALDLIKEDKMEVTGL